MPDAARGPVYGRARGTAPAPSLGNTFAKGVLDERDGMLCNYIRDQVNRSVTDGRSRLRDCDIKSSPRPGGERPAKSSGATPDLIEGSRVRGPTSRFDPPHPPAFVKAAAGDLSDGERC